MSACYDTLLQAWGTLDYMLHLKPPTDIYVMAVNAVKKARTDSITLHFTHEVSKNITHT